MMAVNINRKGLYTLPEDTPVTLELIEKYIQDHKGKLGRCIRNEEMYQGCHEILKTQKPEYKPNNRLVVNFAKYIVDTLNGYFIGIPVKETCGKNEPANEFIQDFIKANDLQDNEAEISKMCSIYGRAFEYLFQDSQSNTRATYLSPIEGFMVYDDTIEELPLFFVRYYYDRDNKLHGEVLTRTEKYRLDAWGEGKQHYFDGVPVIEYIENEERQGAFESVETLINALNKALSEKANDVDYFADAYMKVIGGAIEGVDDGKFEIRENRVIYIPDGAANEVDIGFLEKPSADTTQENLINRLVDLIYQIAMVANVSDDTFSTASSGTALQFKLQPMKNLALNKERKFQASMRRRWQLVFSVVAKKGTLSVDDWRDIEYKFTRNIPQDLESESKVMSTLTGVVSQETVLKLASFIDDVTAEMERLEKEEMRTIDNAIEHTEKLMSDKAGDSA